MKRIICIVLSLIVTVSACFAVSAAAVPAAKTPFTDNGREQIEYHSIPATDPNALVRLYLCAKKNEKNVGHIFIYIENVTDNPVDVGLITLQKDQGVSMGAFGLQRDDGWGVYYNTESYSYSENAHKRTIAVTSELDAAHLAKLNKFLSHANHWDFVFNCACFAIGAWNSCTDDFIFPWSIPSFDRIQIEHRDHIQLPQMYIPPRDEVYHVVGNGKKAHLVYCTNPG